MTSQKIKNKLFTSMILISASLLLLLAAHTSKAFANWYSEHIYDALVNTIGRFFGLFPFSVVEMGLYFLILFLLWKIVHFKRNLWREYGSSLLLTVSILLFLFTINCGINYGSSSFSEMAQIDVSSYTVDELKEVCLLITEQVNLLADQVTRDEDGIAIIPADEVPEKAQTALMNLGTIYPEMEGYYPIPKRLTFPYILSVQKLSGIYSPFTIETNYNSAMTEYNLPFTACHELSHLRGFMQEQEANFIAYLACILSDDPEFQYSGYLSGWIYATNQLYRADYEAYKEVAERFSSSARVDLSANNQFWDQYDGKVAEIADEVNDTYLKANGQSDGVKSYNRMVNLMVAYYTN